MVTTCVVVWIEISVFAAIPWVSSVTTCVVVWIEIGQKQPWKPGCRCHHLRGGVD